MNEWHQTWVIHITHEWVTSHNQFVRVERTQELTPRTNEWHQVWVSHVTQTVCRSDEDTIIGAMYEWVMPHKNGSCYVWINCDIYKSVTLHMNTSHHTNSMQEKRGHKSWRYTRIRHVTYEWVMSHMNESCHIWMSDVTYECVTPHNQFAGVTRTQELTPYCPFPRRWDPEILVEM